jgi:hypothetical protein
MVGGNNGVLRGGKNEGFEGGARVFASFTDLYEGGAGEGGMLGGGRGEEKVEGKWPRRHEGLFTSSDWMPTLLAMVDDTKTGEEVAAEGNRCDEKMQQAGRKPPLGYGHDQSCAMRETAESPSSSSSSSSAVASSPRTDAVIALDDTTNFVSYLRPPYKLLIGYHGAGEWEADLEAPLASCFEKSGGFKTIATCVVKKVEIKLEDMMQVAIDYGAGSRDVGWFWHEFLHLLIKKFRNQFFSPPGFYDFYNAGANKLGPKGSGDVLASSFVARNRIPVLLFNVWEDEAERFDLSQSRPDVLADVLKSFNEHWRDHPDQADWHMSCVSRKRLRNYPAAFCAGRKSQNFKGLDMRGLSNDIPCSFDAPFVDDDDERPCGNLDPPVDIQELFKGKAVKIFVKFLGKFVVAPTLLLAFGIMWLRKKTPAA